MLNQAKVFTLIKNINYNIFYKRKQWGGERSTIYDIHPRFGCRTSTL